MRSRRKAETPGPLAAPVAGSVMQHLAAALVVSGLLATAFTAWTPASLSPGEWVSQLISSAGSSGVAPVDSGPVGPILEDSGGIRIGVVAGHSGANPNSGYVDPGAVCDDGLTELSVNQSIANLVVRSLQAAGYNAELLDEWDSRLTGYRAVALVSIHTDSCTPVNAEATGYKVAAAVDTAVPDRAQRLVTCLADRYAIATGLRFHPGSVTRDMTEYHTFYEVHSDTPAVIIEVGFLFLDRDFLTRNPDKAARGIADGILCYVNNEPARLPEGAGP
ncbi:MAG TPA: N-acetylmuramoyl-L-alanine amidase [Anaerolineales bacterium]|nr:N-acetylmuramoyl-L-alanine amidase [Anaerolineales bacterium]